MQTILGANGQIGEELARELKKNFTSDIRIVSRDAKKSMIPMRYSLQIFQVVKKP